MSQSHLTLGFPLKAPADTQVLTDQLTAVMPLLFRAAETIGTLHYARFTVLSQKTQLFLGDFDGDFSQVMTKLAEHAGSVFDKIFENVDEPPAVPVADQPGLFVQWMSGHLIHPLNVYTAYPEVTAAEIKAPASASDVTGGSEQRPFLVILPIRSWFAFAMFQLLLRVRSSGITKDLDPVGTPHIV